MAEFLTMPEVAAGTTEAVLSGWVVGVGDRVAVGDVVATVETDKAVVDIESEHSGTLVHQMVPAGTTVPVGAPIAVLAGPEDADAGVPALLAALDRPAESAAAPADGVRTGRIFSSPLARRLAREAGIDLADIRGTGPHGRVRRRDVERTVAEASTIVPPPGAGPVPSGDRSATDGDRHHDVPHSRLRRAIAGRLVRGKQETPHFYLRASCRVDRLAALRSELNADLVDRSSDRVSVNDFVIKAVALAHRDVPELNVTWTDDALRHHLTVDVGVAVAVPQGLVVPVVTDADQRSLGDLAATVRDLRCQAEAGALRQHQLEGGSISVSNLGMFGVDEFAAIINPPQAALLAVGAVREEAVVEDGRVMAGKVMHVTLSVDHRAVDGAVAARWLGRLRELLERPLGLVV